MIPDEKDIPEYLREYIGFAAISIRQPWAWMIIHGGKDIENRSRRFKYRGPVLIHASFGGTKKEYNKADLWAWEYGGLRTLIPETGDIERGGIIGAVDIVDCVDSPTSTWFMGPYGLVLRNPRALPFTPCKGALGLFKWENRLNRGVIRNDSQKVGRV